MPMLDDLTVTSVEDVLTVHSPRGRFLQMENRINFGLSFCTEGEIVYTHKGRRIVSDPTCAVLLPMGGSYELHGSRTGDFPLINFLCDADIHDFCEFPIRHLEPYLRDFERMKELLLLGRRRQKVMSLFYEILDQLSQEGAQKGDVLHPVMGYLEKNYADPQLSNEVLAKAGGISEVYLRQLFKVRLGTSPKQYVLELRMQRAKRLLEEGTASVGEIAQGCGFASVPHFCRTFKSFTGESPTDYRHGHRRELL